MFTGSVSVLLTAHSVNMQEENSQNQMALPGKRRSALVFKQKFDLILVLRLSEVSIREHNLSSNVAQLLAAII